MARKPANRLRRGGGVRPSALAALLKPLVGPLTRRPLGRRSVVVAERTVAPRRAPFDPFAGLPPGFVDEHGVPAPERGSAAPHGEHAEHAERVRPLLWRHVIEAHGPQRAAHAEPGRGA